MKYCTRCVQPDTRPGITFSEEGVCAACLWEDEKKNIDWKEREAEALDIANWAKSQGAAFDCVIGVSGGKDSTLQAFWARDVLGLRPLLVCCEPAEITDIGRANLENLKMQGFDTILVRPDAQLMKKMIEFDFYDTLNIVKAAEYPLHHSVYIIADKFDIPLIINGENPAQTLGVTKDIDPSSGDATQIFNHNTIKDNPLERYKHLADERSFYFYQSSAEKLQKNGVRAIWVSHYCKDWSQCKNAEFSIERGFSILPRGINLKKYGTYRRFYSLENLRWRELNQLFKFIKLGFGKATDHACYDIRDGYISREEGMFLVSELDGTYDPQWVTDFCSEFSISEAVFWDHVNSFRGSMWEQVDKNEFRLNREFEQSNSFDSFSLETICDRLKI